MMLSTADEEKRRSGSSASEEEIRQYRETEWPLISARRIRGFGSGRTAAHDQSDPPATRRFRKGPSTGERKRCRTGLHHLGRFQFKAPAPAITFRPLGASRR